MSSPLPLLSVLEMTHTPLAVNETETLYVLEISRLCVLDREGHLPGPLPCFLLHLLCSLGFDSRNPREMGNVTQETQLEYRWTLHSEARSSAPYSIVCNGQSQLSGFIRAIPCSSRPQPRPLIRYFRERAFEKRIGSSGQLLSSQALRFHIPSRS